MCTSPRTIKNPTRSYSSGISQILLDVPCGKCDDCRAISQDAWKLRAIFHVNDYINRGGKVIFVTFTYDNNHLPIYRDVVGKRLFEIPVFNSSDKDLFLNSFRKHFERKGISGISYMWCSEYGESDHHTHRPHYHTLLFLPPEVVHQLPSSENQIKNLIQHFWPFGFCRWSKPLSKHGKGIFVDSEFASDYVTKYCVKDIDFFNQPLVREYLYNENGDVIEDRFKKIKSRLPKHWQSNGFGKALLTYINSLPDPEKVFVNGLVLNLASEVQNGKTVYHSIPRYIENKLCYTYLPDGRRFLNDFGRNVKALQFHSSLLKFNERLSDKISCSQLGSRISDQDCNKLFKGLAIQSVSQLSFFLHRILDYRENDYYYYLKVWKGRYTSDVDEFVYIDSCDDETFKKLSFEQFYLKCNLSEDNTVYVDEGYFNRLFEENPTFGDELYYFDDLQRFRSFGLASSLLNKVNDLYRQRCHAAYLLKRKIRKHYIHEVQR